MAFSRRTFLGVAAPVGFAPAFSRCHSDVVQFRHGVASGDPLSDSVVLWTRVTPDPDREAPPLVVVSYEVASDPRMRRKVASGRVTTSAAVDYTVKVDVAGLLPGKTYYYRFECGATRSPLGRTKTLPVGSPDRLRLAVASCSNYPFGYFHAYRNIAERADLDAVLHLGDYLYEYANGTYGDGTALGRVPQPDAEIVSLADYRQRHAQYKADSDLQEAHRQHPFITVWDDHELTNDANREGAENHQPDTEGDFVARRAAALQAYFEWMPIRRPGPDSSQRIYRSFAFGDLVDLLMLDTRVIGRDPQVNACEKDAAAAERQLLGAEQEAWLNDQVDASTATYCFLGQQVMMAQLLDVRQLPPCPLNSDQWDGYPAARSRVLGRLAQRGNGVVLTGDIHSSWASELSQDPFDPSLYNPATGEGSSAVEFVTPGVTSPGIEDPATAAGLTQLVQASHPHIKLMELTQRGYLLLDVDRDRVQAEWYHLTDVRAEDPSEAFAGAFEMREGTSQLLAVAAPSQPPADPPSLAPASRNTRRRRRTG